MSDISLPQGMHQLSPHLVCEGAAKAIDFYVQAFDATELMRLPTPDGRLAHGCVSINGSSVMLVDEFAEQGMMSPKTLGGTPVTIHLVVADVDAAIAKAADAGASVVMPAQDMFWGDRYGVVEDPFGHRWSIATPKRGPMNSEELQAAMSGGDGCA
jgi:uncharacterized glyoxalase superfamily protein PhnB